jgi:hypothetical protein
MAKHHPASAPPSNRLPADNGELYRVRDKDWDALWGENLTMQEAVLLKNEVTGQRKSRTARIEPMSVPPPDWWVAQHPQGGLGPQVAETCGTDDLSVPLPEAPSMPVPDNGFTKWQGTRYEISSAMVESAIPSTGIIASIPLGHKLLVNGHESPVPVGVSKGDRVACVSLHPVVAAARAAAADAVADVIKKRRVPVDVTVKEPKPRVRPAPPDLTVSKQPVLVRLGTPAAAPPKPLPSPLKVATLEDGDLLPDDAITDDDLPDLAGDLGGGPSDADVEHAKRQAEAERAG